MSRKTKTLKINGVIRKCPHCTFEKNKVMKYKIV